MGTRWSLRPRVLFFFRRNGNPWGCQAVNVLHKARCIGADLARRDCHLAPVASRLSTRLRLLFFASMAVVLAAPWGWRGCLGSRTTSCTVADVRVRATHVHGEETCVASLGNM